MAIAKLKALYEKLKARHITVDRLYNCYAIKQPDKVKRDTMNKLRRILPWLPPDALAVYSYLLCCENRKTCQCCSN